MTRIVFFRLIKLCFPVSSPPPPIYHRNSEQHVTFRDSSLQRIHRLAASFSTSNPALFPSSPPYYLLPSCIKLARGLSTLSQSSTCSVLLIPLSYLFMNKAQTSENLLKVFLKSDTITVKWDYSLFFIVIQNLLFVCCSTSVNEGFD